MNESLRKRLRQLRLSGLAGALDVRLQEAAGHNLSHLEFLELILQDECNVRHQRQLARRKKSADFRDARTLEDFDFSFNPSVKRKLVYDLAAGQFIREARDVLLVGPPGVGKSHIATAIALGAIRAGYRVLVRSAFDLAQDFLEAEALQQRKQLVGRLTKLDLLVIEDFGMKRLGPNAAEDLLEVFVRRHERGSTLVTTNRPTQDWGVFLGDIPAATAILDRFLSHAELVQMQGKSYRMHQRSLRQGAQQDVRA
jgi:DNA replication protein DnaC